ALEIRHEKQPVPDQSPAQGEPILVPAKRILGAGRLIPLSGIEVGVSQELEYGGMILVRSGLGGDTDLAGIASIFRRVDTGFHLEFLNSLDGWAENKVIPIRVGIRDSVKCEIVELKTRSRDGEVLGAAVSADLGSP